MAAATDPDNASGHEVDLREPHFPATTTGTVLSTTLRTFVAL